MVSLELPEMMIDMVLSVSKSKVQGVSQYNDVSICIIIIIIYLLLLISISIFIF